MSWKTLLLICVPALLAAGLCGSEAPARSPEPFPDRGPFQRDGQDMYSFPYPWRAEDHPFFGYYVSALGPEFYRFKSPVLGFEADVPRGWDYRVAKTGGTILSLFAPRGPDAGETPLPQLSVAYAECDPGTELESVADLFVSERRGRWPVYRSTRPEMVVLYGVPGLALQGVRPGPGGEFRESVLLVIRGRYAYTAVLGAAAEDWAENHDLYRQILFSFRPVGDGPIQQNTFE